MKVQSFISRVHVEALQENDAHINRWLAENKVEPVHVVQTFAYEERRDSDQKVPVLVTQVWY